MPVDMTRALSTTNYAKPGSGSKRGRRWQDHGLVFASRVGTPLDASHVRRAFKTITKRAGLGEAWTPRELRHSFVSLMSDNGVPIEAIADLVGHASTAVTEEAYRHQLKPVITRGAETMNAIFSTHNPAQDAPAGQHAAQDAPDVRKQAKSA